MHRLEVSAPEHCHSAGVDAADVLSALIEVLALARGAAVIGPDGAGSAQSGGVPAEASGAEVASGLSLLTLVRHAAAECCARQQSKPNDVPCDIRPERVDGCETVVDLDLEACDQ